MIISLFFQVVLRVESLSSSVLDLGIFSSNLSSIYQEKWRAFAGHFQPLMFIWGGIYQLFNPIYAPIILVSTQFLFVIVSVWWVWREFGVMPGLAMSLYYPLWANVLFDFHFDHLSIPLLTVFFVFCNRQRFTLATVAAASLVLIKEPFSLQVIFCGFYLIWLSFLSENKRYFNLLLWLAFGLIILGIFWFYISIYFILPYFSGVEGLQGEAYSWLGSGILDKLYTVVFRLDIWLIEIFSNSDKIKLLIILFGLLGLIPLLSPAPLIVAIPPLFIMLLAKEELYYSYAYHYTAGLIVPFIIAFKSGIPVALRIWQRVMSYLGLSEKFSNINIPILLIFLGLLVGHSALASSPISRLFWSDKVSSYSWKAYMPLERDKMIKEAIEKYIPTDSDKSISTQNSLNYGHLSARKLYLPFPQGVFTPHMVLTGKKGGYDEKFVDYVILDAKRPWFVVDNGCDWLYGKCTNFTIAKEYLNLVKKTKNIMQVLFEKDGFVILKRN